MLKISSVLGGEKPWRFLSNHTQVLLCVSQDPDARVREIALKIEITERAAHRILADLIDSGYVERVRVGRRNRYLVNRSLAMRHRAQGGQDVGVLLGLLGVTELSGGQPTLGSGSRDGLASDRSIGCPAEENQAETGRLPA